MRNKNTFGYTAHLHTYQLLKKEIDMKPAFYLSLVMHFTHNQPVAAMAKAILFLDYHIILYQKEDNTIEVIAPIKEKPDHAKRIILQQRETGRTSETLH